MYDAESFTVPKNDQIVPEDPKNPNKFCSGRNSLGEYIPGSLILRDIPGERGCPDDLTGNIRGQYWSASACIVHALGIDPNTKEAKSPYAQKGIAVLPLNPSPETVAQVRAECNERWATARVRWAEDVVTVYRDRAASYKRAGQEPPLPDRDYEKACRIIEKERMKYKALEDVYKDAEPTAEAADDFTAFARLAAEDAAKSLSKEDSSVDIMDLAEKLMQRGDFRKAVEEKYKVRKIPVKKNKAVVGA